MTHPTTQRAIQLHRSGNVDEAQRQYRAVLESEPGNFDCLYGLGILMAQSAEFEPAIEWIRQALAVRPDFAEGHFNLGTLCGALRRFGAAVDCFEQAIALDPNYPEAYHNLGNALGELGRYDDALVAFDRAIDLDTTMISAYFNRGNLLKKIRRFDAAVESYRQALALDPNHIESLNNCGNALYELQRFADAMEMFDRAIALKPDYASAHYNRADLQKRLNRWDDAKESLERVMEIDPNYKECLGAYLSALTNCCNWDPIDKYLPLLLKRVRAGEAVVAPFSFLALSDSPEDQLTCAQTCVRTECPPSTSPIWRGERYRHEKIRVAYLSADFRPHPVAFLMSGVFERHDCDAFEITAIDFGPHERSPVRERLEKAFDRFILADRMSDPEVAEKIRELNIDIAVDCMGLTNNARTSIFALRAAPIQVNYLGYPGTMGAPYIDYIVADRFVIPGGHEQFYSEKVVRLPDTYLASDSRRPISNTSPSRNEAGLPPVGFVFCSFNNSYKITRPIFELWMDLLREIDGSVLWLHRKNESMVRNLRNEAEKRGIEPSRLIFAGYVLDNADHLARLRLADLCLDTPIFGAHTTASDSLYAGIPVVTCPGSTFAGRVTMGLLNALGLPELVADTLDAYRALAIRIARDPEFLANLKAKLAANIHTAPLFDTARFTHHLESAYKTMWDCHQRGQSPQAFDVQA